jgi:ribosomal-protein-alanine N-acetyltransferase
LRVGTWSNARVIGHHTVELAAPADAPAIAELSRVAVEHGLRWAWTAGRVRRHIGSRTSNVVLVREHGALAGFAIMAYPDDDEGQLLLLAVAAAHRRRGVATALMAWLEETARVAGLGSIWLQVRAGNAGAIAFYRRLGFRDMELRPRYYQGIEDALYMAKDTSL